MGKNKKKESDTRTITTCPQCGNEIFPYKFRHKEFICKFCKYHIQPDEEIVKEKVKRCGK